MPMHSRHTDPPEAGLLSVLRNLRACSVVTHEEPCVMHT